MSQYRKLTNERLAVDQIIVAFNPKSTVINKPNGTFVKVISKAEKSVKVQVLGTTKELRLNLDIEGAWAYDPESADTTVVVNNTDVWPKFSPRMVREGWHGKSFVYNSAELHLVRDEASPGFGLTLLRHPGETIDEDTNSPFVNNFNMSGIVPQSPPEWRIPRAERMGIGAIELPLPPKPVSAEDQAIIDGITPVFGTLNNHKRENISFAKFNKDLTKQREFLNQACHRALQEGADFKVQYIASYGMHQKGKSGSWNKGDVVNEEAAILYITYLTSYSPYAEAFITKDPAYIMKHGYIVNADAPVRLVVGGLYATRQLWERPARADGFYELYKAGVPLDQAFVFGCMTSSYDGKTMKMTEAGTSHSHLNHSNMSDECIVNFIEHEPAFAGKPYKEDIYASGGGNNGVDGMWSKKFGNQSSIYKKLGNIKGTGSWGSALGIEDVVEQAADAIEDWAGKWL